MATHIYRAIRDENRDVHYGASNVSKTKKKAGLGGLKPLSDITNSEKPSGVKAVNKNKGSVIVLDSQKNRRALADISNANKLSQNKVPDAQKKSGPSGRRALTDISNSKNLSTHQVIEKAFPKKLDDIAEEGFLHNHQGCVDTITRELDLQYYFSTFGFDDDFSAEMGTPLPLKSDLKADFAHSPRYMEYEDIPDLLNEARHQPPRGTVENVLSPCPSYCPSPKFELASP